MLDAANLSDDQKAAWATLLPSLSLAQLDALEKFLANNLISEISEEFSDLLLKAKAANSKRDLSAAALAISSEQELANIAAELTALEAR